MRAENIRLHTPVMAIRPPTPIPKYHNSSLICYNITNAIEEKSGSGCQKRWFPPGSHPTEKSRCTSVRAVHREAALQIKGDIASRHKMNNTCFRNTAQVFIVIQKVEADKEGKGNFSSKSINLFIYLSTCNLHTVLQKLKWHCKNYLIGQPALIYLINTSTREEVYAMLECLIREAIEIQ